MPPPDLSVIEEDADRVAIEEIADEEEVYLTIAVKS